MMRTLLTYLLGFAILLTFLAAGVLIEEVSTVPIPGSVIGMVLLVIALRVGIVQVRWVRPLAELLLRHMALFFVPPGVGLMLYFDLVAAEWLPILLASVVSTLVVLATVGLLQQKLEADE